MTVEMTKRAAVPPDCPAPIGAETEPRVSYAMTLTLAMAGGLALWALIFLLAMALRHLLLAG